MAQQRHERPQGNRRRASRPKHRDTVCGSRCMYLCVYRCIYVCLNVLFMRVFNVLFMRAFNVLFMRAFNVLFMRVFNVLSMRVFNVLSMRVFNVLSMRVSNALSTRVSNASSPMHYLCAHLCVHCTHASPRLRLFPLLFRALDSRLFIIREGCHCLAAAQRSQCWCWRDADVNAQ